VQIKRTNGPLLYLRVLNSFAPADCHGVWAEVPWDQTRILLFFLLFILAWFLCLVVTCGLKGYNAKPRCLSFILDFFSSVLVYYRDVQTEAPWNLLSYIAHPTLSTHIYSMMCELEDNGTLPSSWNCLSTLFASCSRPSYACTNLTALLKPLGCLGAIQCMKVMVPYE
jgi:hypothetical protein